ncbi:MAG: TonB-dependent receptor, partial [Saprospiraceae bacterium]|nr:TonB-dependent receptor [Saprospiraceae bacterium]
LWDFNLAVYLNSHFTVSASLNNIFDRQYFTKRPTIYPGPGIWPSDGRSLVVSVGLRI